MKSSVVLLDMEVSSLGVGKKNALQKTGKTS